MAQKAGAAVWSRAHDLRLRLGHKLLPIMRIVYGECSPLSRPITQTGSTLISASRKPYNAPGVALRVFLPLLAACAVIWLEPVFGTLALDRPGIVPVAVLSLIVGLISPGSRRWLFVTLCYSLSL